jgi:hypothetical protein
MSWIYRHKIFEEKDIPEGAVGFIYQMSCVLNARSYSYIGKKNFSAEVKTKLGKKSLPTDKRLKKYKRVKKYTYQNYYSSNETLKDAHKNGVLIKREILQICYSKTALSYQETKHQFMYGVLESDEWLNGNILGRYFKQR